jgi:ferredoxin-NADP reductase/Na+-translocating ferredoxin:NAD+ oxidoreductase RnfD subunit
MNTLNLFFRRLLNPIDKQLDRLTSYKLVLYTLYTFVGWAILMSALGQTPFKWYQVLLSAAVLIVACRYTNILLSRYLNVARNKESDLVTALILTLILSPGKSLSDFLILAVAGALAMVSKYILVINRWHIFNPAAFGAFTVGLVFSHHASWWIGTKALTPVVFIGGMLILRKMKRFTMVIAFEVVALSTIALQTYLNHSASAVGHVLWLSLISTPILFFAYIMLTEPFTSPRHMRNYLPYAVLVGFLYGYTKLGLSPEEALLIGNIFAYLMEPQKRLQLSFKRRHKEANGIESFVFSGKSGLKYQAGQYLEWTLSEHDSDFRGNRRYFTVSSSPTEKDLMFTVRIPEKMSSFKRRLETFKPGDTILADGLSGEFTLPKSEKQKLAFIAGGVGITPFRSMIKYIVDFEQERDIHLLYSTNNSAELAFKDLFSEAKKFGVTTTYATGLLDKKIIEENIPDYKERIFYISGPYGLVNTIENALLDLSIPTNQIKVDYFPGYGS